MKLILTRGGRSLLKLHSRRIQCSGLVQSSFVVASDLHQQRRGLRGFPAYQEGVQGVGSMREPAGCVGRQFSDGSGGKGMIHNAAAADDAQEEVSGCRPQLIDRSSTRYKYVLLLVFLYSVYNSSQPFLSADYCCLLIHTFSVLSLQLKKLRRHNKSAIDLSNANPACGHKEERRSTGHIMLTTRYSDQQGSKSRQKVMRLYKQWHRPISKQCIKPPYSISRATDRLGFLSPTYDQRSQQQTGQIALQPVLINKSKFLKATHCTTINKLKCRDPWRWMSWAGEAGARASIQPSKALCIPEKPHESCPFAAPCGPRRKK